MRSLASRPEPPRCPALRTTSHWWLLVLCWLFASTVSHADGYFSAKNVINGVERLIYDGSFHPLPAGAGRVEIFDGSTLLASGSLVKDGVFFLGSIYDPVALSSSAILTVHIWDSRLVTTFAEGIHVFNSSKSLDIRVPLSSGLEPPAAIDLFPQYLWLGGWRELPTPSRQSPGRFNATNGFPEGTRPIFTPTSELLPAGFGNAEIVIDGRAVASGHLTQDGIFGFGSILLTNHFAGDRIPVTIRAWDSTTGDTFPRATRRGTETITVGLGFSDVEGGPFPLLMNEFRSFALKDIPFPELGTLSAITPVGTQAVAILDRYGNPLRATVGRVELVRAGQILKAGALSADGRFDFATITVSDAAPGDVVDLTVRAWDTTTGASYDVAAGRGSVTFPVGPLGGEGNAPASLDLMPKLVVTYPLPVVRTLSPNTLTKAAGELATISAEAEGLALNFQWQIQTANLNWLDLAEHSGIEGIATSTLQFPALAESHRGTYRLRVWNSLTNVYSPTTRINVQVPQTLSLLGITSIRFGSDADLRLASTDLLPVSATLVSGPAVLLSQDDMGIRVRPTGVGSMIVHAVQAGDTRYGPAETDFVIPIVPGRQSLAFDAPPDVVWSPAALISLSAASSSGLPVSFRVESGAARVEGTALRLLETGVGLVTVIAEQSGNANYDPSTPVARTFLVSKAPQTLGFDTIPDPTDADPALVPHATASSGLPITFQVISGPARMDANQHVELIGPGMVRIAAIQSGNATYQAASTERSFTVIAAPRDVRLVSTPQGFQLLYRGERGRLYRIESATNLKGTWLEVSPSSADGLDRDTLFQIPSSLDSARFFRVRFK